jgi:hypothetical protein
MSKTVTASCLTTDDTNTVTADQQQQAIDYAVERALIKRAHPRAIDLRMHDVGECDGTCVRVLNGYNLD